MGELRSSSRTGTRTVLRGTFHRSQLFTAVQKFTRRTVATAVVSFPARGNSSRSSAAETASVQTFRKSLDKGRGTLK